MSTAIRLARTYELKAQEVRRPTNPTFSSLVCNSNNQWNTSVPSGTKGTDPKRILPIRKLSPTELQRRRQQGLCYNCDEKYTMGHKCKKLFFIELEEENEEAIEEEYVEETLAISLHALAGVQSPQTMRINSQIGNTPLTILIDSSSNHNFLHHKFSKIV